jgi:hypothetical protein
VVPHDLTAVCMPVDVPAVTDDVPGVNGLSNSHPVFRYADDTLHATHDPADNSAGHAAQHATNRTSHLASGRSAILYAADDSLSLGGCRHAKGGYHEHGGCNRASHFWLSCFLRTVVMAGKEGGEEACRKLGAQLDC